MRLAAPPPAYDARDQTEARKEIERADAENYKRGRDVEIQPGQRVVMVSPNGARWMLAVSNAGVLSVVAL